MEEISEYERAARRNDEGGFTLPEVLITILIMGIVFAITAVSWDNLTEGRRGVAAANQLAADLRLANSSATNQLATWRLGLNPNREAENAGPDYYLVKLDSTGAPIPDSSMPRTLPGNIKVDSPTLLPVTLPLIGTTTGVDFAASGSASPVGSLSPSTVDNCPQPAAPSPSTAPPRIRIGTGSKTLHCITFAKETSRIRIDY